MTEADVASLVDAVREACAGVTAMRVVDGWRIVADYDPVMCDWTVTTQPAVRPQVYPVSPPDHVVTAFILTVINAGYWGHAADHMTYDPSTGALRASWNEMHKEPAS